MILQKGEHFLLSPEYPLFSLTAEETQEHSIPGYCRVKLRRALLLS